MSEINDFHPTPTKKSSIEVAHSFIERRLGVSIKPEECRKYLRTLGFLPRITFAKQFSK